MAVSQGSASGIAGLTLRGWAMVSSAGVLRRGSGVVSSSRGGAGLYTVNLSQATTVPAVAQVLFAGGGDVPPRVNCGGVTGTAQPCTFLDAGGNGQDRDFYVAFYE